MESEPDSAKCASHQSCINVYKEKIRVHKQINTLDIIFVLRWVFATCKSQAQPYSRALLKCVSKKPAKLNETKNQLLFFGHVICQHRNVCYSFLLFLFFWRMCVYVCAFQPKCQCIYLLTRVWNTYAKYAIKNIFVWSWSF